MGPNLLSTSTYGAPLPSDTKNPENLESIDNYNEPDAQSKTRKPTDLTKNSVNGNIEFKKNKATQRNLRIVWRNVAIFAMLHIISIYSAFLVLTLKVKFLTIFFEFLYLLFGGFGITAGAHRLWAHRTYSAKFPLRVFLMLAQSSALQNSIYEWVRDHRVHHKFTDTDADPHNASRGFFFSHVGWLLCKKHPDVFAKGKGIDMSDVLADPIVRFQKRYYIVLILLFNLAIPTLIPWYFWNENAFTSFIISIGRYVLSLNGTWLINSAAHIWGMKPYDKDIKPTDTKIVSTLAFGEGWHNYHHIFPWDYKAAELGNYRFNFTTGFLDLMAKIGLATDLKTTSEEIIRKRALRTGDGSWPNTRKDTIDSVGNHHHHHHHDDSEHVWGWGDKDMKQDEINAIKRSFREKA